MKRIQLHLSSQQGQWLLCGLIVTFAVVCIGQLLYPRDRLTPFTVIDSVSVGGWVHKDATWELDDRLAKQSIPVVIEATTQTYATLKPSDIGLTVSNKARIEAAIYPLWARLIPSSILWYGLLTPNSAPQYIRSNAAIKKFVHVKLGDCRLASKDANINFTHGVLEVIPANVGGICDEAQILSKLRHVEPTISSPSRLVINVSITRPKVDDVAARQLIKMLQDRSKEGIKLTFAGTTKVIDQKEILSWLTFSPKGSTLVVGVDKKASDSYFAKNITPFVAVPAGTTTVTTRDFTEISRTTGKNGRSLDTSATRQSLLDVLNGKESEATAVTQTLKATLSYKRSYTKTSTGISALVAQYDQDNPGVFGVSFTELGGQQRGAAHDENKIFITASTYKLFVAFSTLRSIDSGKYKWSDKIVNGRDLSACFEDMIVKSDNICAEALLDKVGREKLDSDLRSIGLTHSTFRAKTNQTTAAELAKFLMKLQNGDLPIKSSSRDRLLSAMKRQIYRQGVPAGASGTVADKVGFLNGLLHDAAIVYSRKGTYVLVVLSDGSSWASIADLTKKIESLR